MTKIINICKAKGITVEVIQANKYYNRDRLNKYLKVNFEDNIFYIITNNSVMFFKKKKNENNTDITNIINLTVTGKEEELVLTIEEPNIEYKYIEFNNDNPTDQYKQTIFTKDRILKMNDGNLDIVDMPSGYKDTTSGDIENIFTFKSGKYTTFESNEYRSFGDFIYIHNVEGYYSTTTQQLSGITPITNSNA